MKDELISVIVPIYNVEEYLEKCIDSIINQTYKNLEIILIDDGSTDKCGQICDKYKELDNRFLVIHKSNEGLSSARNAGLDIASGDLVSFVDSDDYLEETMLDELKKNMDKYRSDIAVCDYYYVDEIGNKIIHCFSKKEFESINRKKYNNIYNEYECLSVAVWNKIYKKEIFNNIRFPFKKIYEDSYIICELLNKANKVSYLIKPLYNYKYRSNSITNSFNLKRFDKIDSFNKNIDFLNEKGYYDLELEEKNRKMNALIIYLSKMKRYNIKNKEVYKKYYKELLDTNKEVKWKNATWKNRFFKVLRRPSISILAFGLRVRDLIIR